MMMHYDEHTLELYVLGAKEIDEPRRLEIEQHLSDCHGCRALADEIRAYHGDLADELKNAEAMVPATVSNALARRNVSPIPFENDVFDPPVVYRPTTLVQKLRYFVRRHPVIAGVSSFTATGALAAGLALFLMKPAKDMNPTHWNYNIKNATIDVYNNNYDLLWQFPSASIDEGSIGFEKNSSVARTALADINQDGTNELLTTHFLPEDGISRASSMHFLRAFDVRERTLLWKKEFCDSVYYLDRKYSPLFQANAIIVEDFNKDGENEIVVAAFNTNRSPFILFRLDGQGNEIGKYWHFGHLNGIAAKDLDGDSYKEIIACGTNDNDDTTRGEFASIVVLNPRKIIGTTRSSVCTGFQLPETDAELFYIKIPPSDINETEDQRATVGYVAFEADNLRFQVNTVFPNQSRANFDYFFSMNLDPLYVKSNDETDRTRMRLVKQGKLTGTIDRAYLENLREGIRYWNGKEWRSEICRVSTSLSTR